MIFNRFLKFGKKDNGFTLMELIVYFGIFSILLLILTSVFSSSISSQLESESLTNVEHDGRFLLMRFTRDIERSQSITIPASNGNSASTLTIVEDNGESFSYSLNNGNLNLTRDSGIYRLNNFGTTIENLNFTRIGNTNGKNTIKVSFTIKSLTLINGIQETKSFSTVVGTR